MNGLIMAKERCKTVMNARPYAVYRQHVRCFVSLLCVNPETGGTVWPLTVEYDLPRDETLTMSYSSHSSLSAFAQGSLDQ